MKETTNFLWKNVTTAVVSAVVAGISVVYFTVFQQEQAADLNERIYSQLEERLTTLEIVLSQQRVEILRISDRIGSLNYVAKSSAELDFQLREVIERLEELQNSMVNIREQ